MVVDTVYLNTTIINSICQKTVDKSRVESLTAELVNEVIERNKNNTPDIQRKEYMSLLYFDPKNSDVYFAIAITFLKTNNLEEARSFLHTALTFSPNHVPSLLELAIVYRAIDNDHAIMLLERALEIESDNMSVLNTLGVIYVEVNRFEDGLKAFKKVLKKTSKQTDVHNAHIRYQVLGNLATLLSQMGDNKESLRYMLESEKTCYSSSHLQTKLLVLNNLFPHEAAEIIMQDPKLAEAFRNMDDFTKVYQMHLGINSTYPQDLKELYKFDNRLPYAGRKIRVGFVSSDLRNHVVSKFMYSIIKYLDRNRFELFCYYTFRTPDPVTQFFMHYTNFKNIHIMDSKEASKLIYSDNIDILFDLNGNTASSRFDIFVTKPAPIQITYLGYPNTSGLLQMTHRITDKIADTVDTKQKYIEKLLYLDDYGMYSFVNYTLVPEDNDHMFQTGTTLKDVELDLQSTESIESDGSTIEKTIVLGSINRPPKNSEAYFSCIKKILKLLPKSKLLIKINTVQESEQKRLTKKYMSELDVSKDRLIVVNFKSDNHGYYQLFNKIDILLDTFPYSGTTTTCDALYMSTPVITLHGPVHSHNVSSSILYRISELFKDPENKSLTTHEFIATDESDYINKVVNLANSPEKITEYKKTLKAMFVKSQDSKGFVQCFEKVLESCMS